MKKLSIIAVLMLAILTISIAPVFAIVPHNADAMWIEPLHSNFSTLTTTAGHLFNITVYLNMTEDVFSWQVLLEFDKNQLQCVKAGWTGTPIPTSEYMGAHSGVHPTPSIDNVLGTVLVFESALSPDFAPGPNSGSLCYFTMNITKTPDKVNRNVSSTFDIYDTYVLTDTFVAAPVTGNLYQLNQVDNAYYEFDWAAPTTFPHMGIEHDTGFGVPMSTNPLPAIWPVTWGPSPPSAVGSGFTASLYIKNLDPAWGLWNASFTLTYNSTVISVLGGAANVTIDSHWTGANTKIVTEVAGTGKITIYVENYAPGAAGGNVLVATVKFTIMIMGNSPPLAFGYFDDSLLTYSIPAGYGNYYFYDPPGPGDQPINHTAPDQGEVKVYSMIALPVPYLKVVPASTVIGPAPSIGTTFSVNVEVVNMSSHWYCVGVQFRLQYDSSVLSFVSVNEGGFLTDPTWDLYGTSWPIYSENILADPVFGDHVLVFDMVYPNTTNGLYDQPCLPNTVGDFGATPAADPSVMTLTFKVLKQNCFCMPDIVTFLNLPPVWYPSDCLFIDWLANYIPSNPCLNGTVTILSLNEVERQIDLVGGAVNDGYGALPLTWPFPYPAYPYYTLGSPYYLAFPTPYGGQGPNHWMDIVFPQSLVYLNVYVTYNYWPVQRKDVGFELEGPYEHISNQTGDFYVPLPSYKVWAKFTSVTDSNGVAIYATRMPWPCDDPDGITGVWKITATVTVADQVVVDTMLFYYERLVYITEVSTEKYSYLHNEFVDVEVEYQTHAVQKYPALFAVVLVDNLTVPFGMATYSTLVGGATFCTWKEDEFTLRILIPKWAYAGIGYVKVSVYDKDPTVGGEPYCPQFPNGPYIENPPGWDDPTENHVWDSLGTQIDINPW